MLVHWSYRKRTTHVILYKYGHARRRMHGESSLQLIALTGGTDVSNDADLNIICNKIVQLLLASAYKKIVKKF